MNGRTINRAGQRAAVGVLYEAGAHMVRCNADKSPVGRWRHRPVVPEVAVAHLEHRGPLAVVPASIGAVVVDVDRGEAVDVWDAAGSPWTALRTARGWHGYYDAPGTVSEARWALAGASGELKHRGYVVLHGAAALFKLAGNLLHRVPAPLQLDLFLGGEVTPPRAPRAVVTSPVLEAVEVGGRNVALFDWTRFKAYGAERGGCLDAWVARCKGWALAGRRCFKDVTGFPEAEAARIGYSVAVGTWNRKTTDGKAQHRRGVKSFYGDAKPGTLEVVEGRHARLRADLVLGMNTKEAARVHGYAPPTVRNLRRRWGLDFTR